jgi:hypothetical protein
MWMFQQFPIPIQCNTNERQSRVSQSVADGRPGNRNDPILHISGPGMDTDYSRHYCGNCPKNCSKREGLPKNNVDEGGHFLIACRRLGYSSTSLAPRANHKIVHRACVIGQLFQAQSSESLSLINISMILHKYIQSSSRHLGGHIETSVQRLDLKYQKLSSRKGHFFQSRTARFHFSRPWRRATSSRRPAIGNLWRKIKPLPIAAIYTCDSSRPFSNRERSNSGFKRASFL